MAIVKPVDQMQIARTAASGTDRQLAREVRFGTGGECGGFLVSHTHPMNVSSRAQAVGDAVQRVAGNSVDPADTCFGKNIHKHFCNIFLCHLAVISSVP
jgi:hypothetical protein